MPVMQQSELEKVAPLRTISRRTFRAFPLARHTMLRSGMASTGFLGVSLPCNPIRDMGETLYALHVGSWGGASGYSSVRRRSCVCPSRSGGRMQYRYSPRDLCGTCPSCQERRGDHTLRFFGCDKTGPTVARGGSSSISRINRSVGRRLL